MLDIFVRSWVSRFGLPAHVTTDRGAQFTSGTWTTRCNKMQVDHITTMAFHPQANGMVERLHRQLKDALHARGAASAWADHLPWVILGLCVAPKDESGVSSLANHKPQRALFQLPYMHPWRLLLPLWIWQSESTCGTPLADKYKSPFQVLSCGPRFFKLKMGEREDTISRDRLKPQRAVEDPFPAALCGRGRLL